MDPKFGEFMLQLRGPLSLRAAAKKCDLNHNYIRDLELGFARSTHTKVKPSPDVLKKLAAGYNYPYEDFMKWVGYLPGTPTKVLPAVGSPERDPLDEANRMGSMNVIDLEHVLYVEIADSEIIYHIEDSEFSQVSVLYNEFSEFLENLQELGFKKMTRTMIVNFQKIQKYDATTGNLYFNPEGTGKHVTISAIKAKQYQRDILVSVSNNTNMTPSISMNKKESPTQSIFSNIMKDFT